MTEPILVTRQEYYTIAFVLFQSCLWYTITVMFRAPHEKDEEDEGF